MKLFFSYLQKQLCWINQGQEHLLLLVSFHVANKKELKTENVETTRMIHASECENFTPQKRT